MKLETGFLCRKCVTHSDTETVANKVAYFQDEYFLEGTNKVVCGLLGTYVHITM